jgi:hypothetical protein
MRDDVVIEAAPILKWALHKDRSFLRDYFKSKGWSTHVMRHPLDEGKE